MNCPNAAEYRFTWPGRNESFICHEHEPKLRAVAGAINLGLQIIPIWNEDGRIKCQQETENTEKENHH